MESPGSVVETVRHESQVIFRITTVMSRPMMGSPIGAPSATTIALATTPSETNPSTRAWLPSAISAGLVHERRSAQDSEADRNGLEPLARAQDGTVYETVRVPVLAVMVMLVLMVV